jgi:hypothetical protein
MLERFMKEDIMAGESWNPKPVRPTTECSKRGLSAGIRTIEDPRKKKSMWAIFKANKMHGKG